LGMREWAAGIPFRGARPPSGAPAQQGGAAMAGVGHGAGACVVPAHVTGGIGRGRGKKSQEEADRLGPTRQREKKIGGEIAGPAVCVGPKEQMGREAGCGLVNPRGRLGVV
jgi:hypothetical protein